jgi:2-dehydropantoate 2-reductase
VRELMQEIVMAARAQQMKISDEIIETQISRTRSMGAYKASTLIDFERGQPIEMESLFLEPLRQARRTGVPTPRLEGLCSVLSSLPSHRG